MARKGAMQKDPPLRGQARKDAQAKAGKTPTPPPQGQAPGGRAPSKWTRTGPGTYKDQYGNVVRGQQKAPTRDMSQRGQTTGQTTQTAATPTPESITEQGFMGSADLYGNMMQQFQGFDPYQMQQKYEPGFQQEMERARQNVLGQFERRNQRQFEQQRTSLQQQIAERGLDPASPAAQELMRQQNEREDMARQEAMSAAEQAAYSVQQQGFGQAGQLATMPYDIYGSTFAPAYMAGIGAQYSQQQQQQQQDWQARQAELDRRNQRWMLRNQPRGGGGGGQPGPTLWDRIEAESLGQGQGQQQNPWAAGAQGFAAGVGQGVGRWIGS